MYFYRARYYDPKVGRFVTKDPIGFEGDDVNFYAYVDSVGKPWAVQTNLYQYADNNPINKIDPTGLSACSTTCHLTALAAATPICHWMLYSGPEGPAFFIICEVLYHTLFYDQCMEKCEKPSPCKK
jgi:hypothetical protein